MMPPRKKDQFVQELEVIVIVRQDDTMHLQSVGELSGILFSSMAGFGGSQDIMMGRPQESDQVRLGRVFIQVKVHRSQSAPVPPG
jgi:hypothetical protein